MARQPAARGKNSSSPEITPEMQGLKPMIQDGTILQTERRHWFAAAALVCGLSQCLAANAFADEVKVVSTQPEVANVAATKNPATTSTDGVDDESVAAGEDASSKGMAAEPLQVLGPGEMPSQSLAPLIELARRGMKRFETEVDAYTCLLVKRETIDGKLEPAQYLRLKIRDRRVDGDRLLQPLSIYARFLKPKKVAGREVLYVEDRLNGDLLVRRGGTRLPNLTLTLDPEGRLAKTDTNYSITQTGIRPMLEQILDRMESQPKDAPIKIRLFADAKVDGRNCQHVEIRQCKRFPGSDYQLAKVYIDDEWKLPVYFASYAWPASSDVSEANADPVMKEQYVITKIDLDAKLSDLDFDRSNPAYRFRNKDDDGESKE